LGAAKHQYPAAGRLVAVAVPEAGATLQLPSFKFELRKKKLRQVHKREGRYLLRSNLSAQEPEKLWQFYMQLTQVCRHANARRAFSHHRRTGIDFPPLHPAGNQPQMILAQLG